MTTLDKVTRLETRLLDVFERDPLTHELLEFCAHVLRFPLLRKAAAARLSSATDPREHDVCAGLLSAFDDDWSGRHLYTRLRDGLGKA